jgi:hypothetical protein
MIWNFAEYMSNSKWRDEAIRRSLRNIQSRKQAVMVEKEAQRRREKKINGGNCVNATVNVNANGGGGGRNSDRSSGISNEKEKDDIAEDDGDNKTNSISCTRLHRKETRRQRFERIMNDLYQQTLVLK